jgi:hypothetical protein
MSIGFFLFNILNFVLLEREGEGDGEMRLTGGHHMGNMAKTWQKKNHVV